ncbi:MAG: hypothetical protein LAP87_08510 [Acidobacteriia bacterium]|nr:hypothetical protein [Terriglobia bacterium]
MSMNFLRPASRVLTFAVAAAALYMGWVFWSRHQAALQWNESHRRRQAAWNADLERVYGGTALKILQFYARDGNLAEGEKTVVCYGVLNAKSVRIEPPLEGVSVSLSRCVEAAPRRDTKYTLTAEGADGQTVSASFAVKVKPARQPR